MNPQKLKVKVSLSKKERDKMKITVREIFKLGLWNKYCEENGINEWAVNEGLMSEDEVVEWNIKESEEK